MSASSSLMKMETMNKHKNSNKSSLNAQRPNQKWRRHPIPSFIRIRDHLKKRKMIKPLWARMMINQLIKKKINQMMRLMAMTSTMITKSVSLTAKTWMKMSLTTVNLLMTKTSWLLQLLLAREQGRTKLPKRRLKMRSSQMEMRMSSSTICQKTRTQ